MKFQRMWLTAALALAALLPRGAAAAEVTIYAAASLSEAVKDVAAAYEAQSGDKVTASFGPSSALAKQLKAGAPADLFFSADAAQVEGLVAANVVRAADVVALLSNQLVVIVPANAATRPANAAEVAKVARLALADPAAVPAGVYAKQWLESRGAWQEAQPHVVPVLDVRAALAAVESENADAGIVYKTDAAVSQRVQVAFEVPREEGPSIVYPLALVTAAPSPSAARAFAFFTSSAAREIYARRGFIVLPARK